MESSLILYLYPNLVKSEISPNVEVNVEEDVAEAGVKINYICKINIITQYKENHILGSCKIGDIINFNWKRWKYNRPPDEIRVNEIVEYINRGHSLDWLIHFIYSNNFTYSDNGGEMSKLEVYDGLHRMTALSNYISQYEITHDNECPLRDTIILVSIRINPTLGEIVDAFQLINKSIPIPELYVDVIDSVKNDIVESVVEKWTKNYKHHFKSSLRTNIPNVNKDCFIDIVSKIYDHYKIKDKKKLEHRLNKINKFIMENIETLPNYPFSKKTLDKCKDSGCYMFLVKSPFLFDFIIHHEI